VLVFLFGHPPAFQRGVNAIAITANDPLGILGDVIRLKRTRGGAAFDNLFSAFESSGTLSVKASPVVKSAAAATSKQIANAMIRTMLMAPARVPMVSTLSAPPMELSAPQESENRDAPASLDLASGTADHPQSLSMLTETESDPAPAQTSRGGDVLPLSMPGLESPPVQPRQVDESMEAEVEPDIPNATALGEENNSLAAPARKTGDTAKEIVPQVLQKEQNGPSQVTLTPATVPLEASSIAEAVPMITPQAPAATAQTVAAKAEASPPAISYGTRTQTIAIPEIPHQQTGAEAVARTFEPAKISTALAPLAFSVELTPIPADQTAPVTNSGVTGAPVDSSQVSQPVALPPTVLQPEVPQPAASQPAAPQPAVPGWPVPQATVAQPAAWQPAVSQPAIPQPKSFDAPAVGGENDKTRSLAPQQREEGSTSGRDDRTPQRETRDNSNNEAPAAAIQASAGASGLGGGWTMNAAPVTAVTTPDALAGPLVGTVRTSQTTEPVPPPAAATSAAPATPSPVVQEIAVRISQPDSPAVDVHVTEHAGEIHVAVRTPDVELQASLRQDLGTLTNSLERAGYHAETIVPRAAGGAQMNLRDERPGTQPGFSGRGGSQGESGSGKQKGQREQRGTNWLEEQEQST